MKRGGAVKKRGGGMMGPKKKMAKGGAIAKAKLRKPSGRLTSDDVKRAMPTGRSAAAKKAAMKGTKGGAKAALMGSIMKGKGNPAGKDMSVAGKIRGVTGLLKRRKALGGRKPGRMGGGKKKQMPTYATTADFDLSIDDIAEEAFERCGLQIRSGYDIKTARRSINLMLAEWANRGLNLWTIQKQEKTLPATTTELSGTSLFGSGANSAQQIIDITDLVIRDSSNNEYSTTSISRSTYLNYTVKTTSGRPSQYYFERTINPKLFLYPAADTTYTLVYYALVRMKDSGAYTNNAEIPFRFLPCLTAGLAYYIAMKKAPDRIQLLKQIYEDEFQRAAAQDGERTSLFLTPKVYLPSA